MHLTCSNDGILSTLPPLTTHNTTYTIQTPIIVSSGFELEHCLNFNHPYLKQRGLDEQKARDFGIGELDNKIYIPLFDLYGNFVNYVTRIFGDVQPKYDFTEIAKSKYLYNYHKAKQIRSKTIVVVEGFFGLVAVHNSIHKSVVALMGSSISEQQEQYLTRWWDNVILMLDGDKAGRETQQRITKNLSQRGMNVYKINLPDKAQPDHFKSQELHQFFNNLIKV